MEEVQYVLWHTQRQGWLEASGVTTTEYKSAVRLPRSEAIKRCERFYNKGTGIASIIPVPVDDLQSIGVQ